MNKLASRVAARHQRRAYFISNPTQANITLRVLTHALAAMKGGSWLHWAAHWAVQGESSVADHELFERLYYRWVKDIDVLAEKIIGMFGSKSIDPYNVLAISQEHIERFKTIDCLHKRSLALEEDLQVTIRTVYDILKSSNSLSLGMDDFLMAMANEHETFIYLLQQRVADDSGRPGIEKAPYDFSLVGEPNESL